METKIYHGDIKPEDFARALIAEFNHSNMTAQQVGRGNEIVIQLSTRTMRRSGGKTALTVALNVVEDGVSVRVGKQSWFGIAASLGTTALSAVKNPLAILGRLDDVAQDIESLQLTDRVWEVIKNVVWAAGASHELSERLRTLVCQHCDTANPVGSPSCLACGAPLGGVQPVTCKNCGFIITEDTLRCPNCNRNQ